MAISVANLPNWTQISALLIGVIAPVRVRVTTGALRTSGKEMPAVGQSTRLTVEKQWGRLSAVVTDSIGSANNAGKLQSAATQQLDLAQYALSTLVDELAAVMTVPGRRENKGTVHVFELAAMRTEMQSLAA